MFGTVLASFIAALSSGPCPRRLKMSLEPQFIVSNLQTTSSALESHHQMLVNAVSKAEEAGIELTWIAQILDCFRLDLVELKESLEQAERMLSDQRETISILMNQHRSVKHVVRQRINRTRNCPSDLDLRITNLINFRAGLPTPQTASQTPQRRLSSPPQRVSPLFSLDGASFSDLQDPFVAPHNRREIRCRMARGRPSDASRRLDESGARPSKRRRLSSFGVSLKLESADEEIPPDFENVSPLPVLRRSRSAIHIERSGRNSHVGQSSQSIDGC
ncbi:hypothetical protein B0H14DRAFT_2716647 [Mycena olivaceomarginata]|nr:hypothetical protein B0H14DRAFT_2716647 [Mycena olivaceomarginata]